MIERLCKKFHKLPSEVLNEDWEWLQTLMMIDEIDKQKLEVEGRINQMKNKNVGR